MKSLLLGAAALLSLVVQGHAASVPATYAPHSYSNLPQYYSEGVTDSVPGMRLSPFAGTSADGRPYDVVYGNNDQTFGYGTAALYTVDQFAGSSGANGTFRFLDGSPDDYNYLLFFLNDGTKKVYSGSQIAPVTGSGYAIVNLTGIGSYSYVAFGSLNQNAFEYAALSAVPLPASAPMFGAALMALGAVGYGMKRKAAKTA